MGQATFLRDDLTRYYNMFDQVDRKLESLEFIKDKDGTNIRDIQPAEAPKLPNNDNRLRYMAIAPVAVLVSLLGLFLIFGHDRR